MNYLEKLLEGVTVEWKPLGDVSKIQRGASPRPISKFITDNQNGVPWIKIGDVASGEKFITKTAQKINKIGAEKSRKVRIGDFIVSNSNRNLLKLLSFSLLPNKFKINFILPSSLVSILFIFFNPSSCTLYKIESVAFSFLK